MQEIWKPVKGFEGLYEVSNLGRVRRNRILKPHNTGRYLQACLCKNGKQSHVLIHRLVAEAFVENPNNLPEVNHKDEDIFNNAASNLEWMSRSENLQYGTRNARIGEAKSKAVKAFQDDGTFVGEYKSISEAALKTGLAPINICRCCKGIYKHSGGLVWRYAERGAENGG